MKINTLQVLRAFAALSVVITHVFQKTEFKPFNSYFLSGQYGVDLFFILSGFLIYLTTKENSSIVIYAKKRVLRIYPLYLLALIFYTLIKLDLGEIIINWNIMIQNILMFPWSTQISYKSLIVGVAWSTVFEMFFYFLFFIILLFKLKKKFIFCLIPLIFFSCYSLIKFNIVADNTPFVSLLLSLGGSRNLFMFLMGCVLSYLNSSELIPLLHKRIYIFLLVISIVLMFIILLLQYNFYSSFIVCSFLFMTVSQYEKYFELNLRSPLVSTLVYLGDISYSIYIFHILIIKILMSYFNVTNIWILLAATILLVILVSAITYELIEKKFINLGKKQRPVIMQN